MKKSGIAKWFLYFLVVCALIGVLAFLVVRTQGFDIAHQQQMQNVLSDIRQANSDWDVDILKSSQGLTSDYDPLSERAVGLVGLEKKFNALSGKSSAAPTQLTRLIGHKTELVDSFKSQNAVLRNSLRYISTAYDEMHESYERFSSRERKAFLSVDLQSQAALSLLLRYNLFPDATVRRAVDDSLSLLAALAAQGEDHRNYDVEMNGAVKDYLARAAMFGKHAGMILQQRETVSALLAEIQAIPVAGAIDALFADIEAEIAAGLARENEYRNYLVLYSALLLLLVFYFAVRLVRSYRQLSVANRLLSEANETLESRVRERTAELNLALENLKASEASLVQSEKMASLGQMVAGVAHEINTPLAYVRSTLETVESNIVASPLRDFVSCAERLVARMKSAGAPPDGLAESCAETAAVMAQLDGVSGGELIEEVGRLVQDGLYGVDQIGELVQNLKSFSRMDKSKTTVYDIEKAIDSSLLIARHETRSRHIVKHYQHVPPVFCAPSQINQVFLNIITNAVHATEEPDGTISIATFQPDSDHVAIRITDNGSGIDADVIDRVFDPFFTTKEIGKGTGLGLSIAYKIIEQHGGTITVSSKTGEGTSFLITLPVGHAEDDETEKLLAL